MPIDALPSISRSDPDFRVKVDDYFLTRLPTFSTQAEAARVQIVAAEGTATSAASTASNAATTASNAATTATTAADTATSASSSAVTAKNAAELAAAQAVSGNVATPIHEAVSKNTPVDADELGLSDSAASWGLKKLTFANLKAWIGGLFVSKSGGTMTGALTATGLLSNSGAIGYDIGSGGTVTQATNKNTAVSLNKPCGWITMHNAELAAGASVDFSLSNTFIASTDTLTYSVFGFINYAVQTRNVDTGIATLRVTNTSASSLSEAVIINFEVRKVATS